MGLMNNLKTKKDVATDEDRIGGGFQLLDTNLYAGTIKYAYVSVSDSGAMALNLQVDVDGQTHSQTEYMTSGEAKGCSNTYKDQQGNEKYLPGFIFANSLCLLAVGEEIADLEPEEKVINLYNRQESKEMPTKVQMLMELVGVDIKFLLERQEVDKQVKNDAGSYVNSGETREINKIVKFVRPRDNMTVTEIQAEAEEAIHVEKWVEKFAGEVINRAKGASSGSGAKSGSPAKGGKTEQTTTQSVKSLFK
ncbi:hypothetical protein [Alteromonas sp. BMJM2]|uniref:hypothetical protein n=1 Tax=Alteromonas sp. BMJM2 TaxID=2954241 RepID=UPI0022B41FD4|nr:hypothetical protein [Alteromonas sp. BMJM2]